MVIVTYLMLSFAYLLHGPKQTWVLLFLLEHWTMRAFHSLRLLATDLASSQLTSVICR